MSQQTDLLREIAAAMTSGVPDRISDWFTEDFRLHEPGRPALPVGHEGARQMMEAGRQNRMRAGVTSAIPPRPATTADIRGWRKTVPRPRGSVTKG